MSTYFQQLKNEIENDGFQVQQTTFESGAVIYEVVKIETEKLTLVSAQVAENVAFMLSQQTRTAIKVKQEKADPLNFTPVELKPDQVQLFQAAHLPDQRIHQPVVN